MDNTINVLVVVAATLLLLGLVFYLLHLYYRIRKNETRSLRYQALERYNANVSLTFISVSIAIIITLFILW